MHRGLPFRGLWVNVKDDAGNNVIGEIVILRAGLYKVKLIGDSAFVMRRSKEITALWVQPKDILKLDDDVVIQVEKLHKHSDGTINYDLRATVMNDNSGNVFPLWYNYEELKKTANFIEMFYGD